MSLEDEELSAAVGELKTISAQPIGFTRHHWRLFKTVLAAVDRRGFGPAKDPQVDDLYRPAAGSTVSTIIAEAQAIRAKLTKPQEQALIARRQVASYQHVVERERPNTREKVISLGLVGADGCNLTELGRLVLGIIDRGDT